MKSAHLFCSAGSAGYESEKKIVTPSPSVATVASAPLGGPGAQRGGLRRRGRKDAVDEGGRDASDRPYLGRLESRSRGVRRGRRKEGGEQSWKHEQAAHSGKMP